MKTFKYIALFAFVLVGVFLISASYFFYGEHPKSQFTTYQEAKESGLMAKGWIPDFIPRSATNIKEQHSIDTNWVEMSFDYEPQDLAEVRKACDTEIEIDNGLEFSCTYFGSIVSMRLYNNGKGVLNSSLK